MELREFIKKYVFDFLLIQAGITLFIGIIGCIHPTAERPDYSILFLPFLYSFFCLLPSFVTYSARESGIKQMLFRKVIQFLLIEFIVLLISYFAGALTDMVMCMIIALSVVIIYALVNYIDYRIEKADSSVMTQKIQQIKAKEKEHIKRES